MVARSRAFAAGFVSLGLAFASPVSGQAVVRGIVVDSAGAPIEGATVRAFALHASGENGPALSEATSASTGAFELAPLDRDRAQLEVVHPDFLPLERPLGTRPAEAEELRLVLSRGGRIDGRATLLHGTPLQNLPVESLGSEGLRTVTHEDGTFVIDRVPPGRLSGLVLTDASGAVQVARGQFASGESEGSVQEGETSPVTFRLDVVRIRGRLTRAGAPLGHVLLRPDEGWQRLAETQAANAGISPGPPAAHRPPGQAVTAVDGSFDLFQRPGPLGYLIESLEGTRFYARRRIDFPKSDDSVLDIDLPAAETVAGVVVDKETGQGLTATVQVRPQTGRMPDGEARWWRATFSEGKFQFDLEPGEYIVGAVRDTYASAETSFTSSGGSVDLLLEMEHTLSIRGRVLNPAGGEVRSPLTARSEDGRDLGHTMVEEDGTFRVFGLQQKRYNLFVGSPQIGWDAQAGVEAGAEDVTLTLRPPGQLHLVVLSPDGQPIPNAFATLRSVSAALVAVHTDIGPQVADAAGRLELTVPAGTIEIDLVSQLYRGTLKIDVASGVSLTSSLTLSEPSKFSR